MRPRVLLSLLVTLLLPATASAERYALGVSFTHADGDGDPDGWEGRGIHGRFRLGGAVSAELELARGDTEASYLTRRVGAFAVVDLGAHGRVTPVVLAGVAGERAENGLGGDDTFRALELGAGLRVRLVDQLYVGADLRVGEREHVGSSGDAVIQLWAPGMIEGRYTSYRLAVGVSF